MVDVREAARLTHRAPETIRRWVWNGRLPATKQGNRLLIARDLVTALADAHEAMAAQDSQDSQDSLAAWAERVTADRTGLAGASAADLVWDDRAGR